MFSSTIRLRISRIDDNIFVEGLSQTSRSVLITAHKGGDYPVEPGRRAYLMIDHTPQVIEVWIRRASDHAVLFHTNIEGRSEMITYDPWDHVAPFDYK